MIEDKLLDEETKMKIKRILFESSQETIPEAVIADIIDAIPGIGDLTNLVRVLNAKNKGDMTAFAIQTGDLLLGLPPGIGEVGDIITPSNTILTILKQSEVGQNIRSKIRRFR